MPHRRFLDGKDAAEDYAEVYHRLLHCVEIGSLCISMYTAKIIYCRRAQAVYKAIEKVHTKGEEK